MRIAYQLYSAREAAQQDLPGVLHSLKKLGYEGVEFAGFYGYSADNVRRILDEAGLVAVSSHVPMQLIEKDMPGTIAYHQAIGCKYIAVPYLDDTQRPGAAGFAAVLNTIHQFGTLCKAGGITLLYHNHDFEFCTVSGVYGLDFLYQAIPADILQTEIDTCWVKYAGEDPAAYIRKYAGRAPLVHIKDFVGNKGEGNPYALIGGAAAADEGVAFQYRPVGHGSQDVPGLVAAAKEAGAGWLIVEQDDWYDQDPLELAWMSIESLR